MRRGYGSGWHLVHALHWVSHAMWKWATRSCTKSCLFRNRAITLGDGSGNLQLIYAPGFTTLSVFLPVIGLTGAFAAAEYRTAKPLHHWLALSVTGIIAGLSVVGMHYIGNLGVSNYTLVYTHRFLAAAIIIAEGDCMLVLALFYTWREAWISSWWKRLFCAAFLAGGVSSMHFTASVGCKYVFRHYSNDERQRDIQVLIAGVLCGAAVVTFLTFLFLQRQKSHLQKKRAQKVVLACATFDPEGKILVNTDGTLPAREITDKYNSTGFADDFNTAHSVLHWIFRVSYNWAGVSDLVPKMRSHLTAQRDNYGDDSRPTSAGSSAVYDPSTYSDYSVIFRERFCVAAQNLAASMHLPLEKVGVLYDRVIETGTLRDGSPSNRHSRPGERGAHDIEMGARRMIIGKGQVLFVVRSVDMTDADKLLNAGYRFASVPYVARTIADSLQIPVAVLESHCAELQRYISDLQTLDKAGTWLTLFAPIPKVHGGGFDLAVNKYDQNQLPDAQLLKTAPQSWQHEFLALMDGLKPQACLRLMEKRLSMNEVETTHSIRERTFARAVINAIQTLSGNVPTEWFQQAHFVAKARQAHYSQLLGANPVPTTIYSFVVMADMHIAIDAYDKIARVPMSFFSMRQRCYNGSPDHQVLARDIHAEFGPLLGRKIPKEKASSRFHMPSMGAHKKQPSVQATTYYHERSASYTDTDTSSENGLVDKVEPVAITTMSMPEQAESVHHRDNVWGGILVNSETTVKTDSTIGLTASDLRMNEFGAQAGLGLQTAVGTAKQEDTFVEELLSDTRAKFLPPKPGY